MQCLKTFCVTSALSNTVLQILPLLFTVALEPTLLPLYSWIWCCLISTIANLKYIWMAVWKHVNVNTDSMWQVSFRNEKYLLKNILCTRVTFLIVFKRHLSGSDFVFSFSLTGISFCIGPKRQIALATEFLCWTFVLVWTGLNTTLQCNLMF